jgi:Tfp pilus assembly protein PilV
MRNDMSHKQAESGFTLVEALVAIVVLIFGLIAVSNLLIVAGASNAIANQSTAATTQASQVMERLKLISFQNLVIGGNLTTTAAPTCNDDNVDCVGTGAYSASRTVDGVGQINTYWQITAGPSAQSLSIRVVSQGTSPLARERSRADFTTFRSCTSTEIGCPNLAVVP